MRTKKAFTMVELVLTLVIIAVIATFTIPRLKRDTRSEAINHMLTMIRYTQNLALHDSKHNRTNSEWQKAFWRLQFYKCSNNTDIYYSIVTDIDYNGRINQNESAIDPSNGKLLYFNWTNDCSYDNTDPLYKKVSPNIFITNKYGIKSVTFKGCTLSKHPSPNMAFAYRYLGFDSFGRPHGKFGSSTTPNHKGYAVTDCKLEFHFVDDDNIAPFTIVIPSESGYAYLQENKNL